MTNVDTQKVLNELAAREPKEFTVNDGDQVRLENGIYTAGEYNDGLGFDMTVEDHTADIPFIGEIYYHGKRPAADTPLEHRTFIKEHDVINYGDTAYMVVRLHQIEDEDGYSLIDIDSLYSASQALPTVEQ